MLLESELKTIIFLVIIFITIFALVICAIVRQISWFELDSLALFDDRFYSNVAGNSYGDAASLASEQDKKCWSKALS